MHFPNKIKVDIIMKLEEFGYRNVQLKESHWKMQRDTLTETYLGIRNDDLLHYFRKIAGIKDSADGLAGWYGENASTFGQILGAFVKIYINTGDERIHKKVIYLADEWGKCARKSRKVLLVNSTYVYDKLMGGFLDMYEYLGYQPALEYTLMLTKEVSGRFNRNVGRDGLQIMEPWMIEWYTLPEQLLRAYQLTGEKLYQEFATVWDYRYFWDKLSRKDFAIGPRHAYSHVNSLSSALRNYMVSNDEYYLNAAITAYNEITTNHTFATGGYGPAECLFADEDGYLGDSLKANWDLDKINKTYHNFAGGVVDRDDQWGSCEVSCCSWAVFKLCNYLMRITGEARYGAWTEQMLINGTGGQLPITSEGNVMYYADYFINGALKTTEDGRLQASGESFEWQCCTGTFPQDVAEYSNMLYYHNDNGIYISQYLHSSVSFDILEKEIIMENTSCYPKEKEIRFVVHIPSGGKVKFSASFRVPSWAKGKNSIAINEEKQNVPIAPDNWATIEREWQEGDEIRISFEFILRFVSADSKSPNVKAICYGPITLVCNKMTLFTGDTDNPSSWIDEAQIDGYSYAFITKKGHVKPYEHLVREFYPYYEVGENDWYYMYNRFV